MEIPQVISDDDLRASILAALAADERTAHADLRVGVLNGIVHLAGAIDTLEIRDLAEGLAQSMEGVRGVVNRVEAPGAPSPSREINLDLKTNNNSS